MGLRLGHKTVKILKWMKQWRKSRSYTRLHKTNSRKSVGLRLRGGNPCRKWVNSQVFLDRARKSGVRLVHASHRGRRFHVPRGCLAVYVGQGEEHRRFVIPALYFNNPLFGELLKEAEEEYGFQQEGPINLPCQVADFENVKRQIHTQNRLILNNSQIL